MRRYYYLDASGKPNGPVPFEDLMVLYRAGTLGPETQVAADGDREWKPLRVVAASEGQSIDPRIEPQYGAARPQGAVLDRPAQGLSTHVKVLIGIAIGCGTCLFLPFVFLLFGGLAMFGVLGEAANPLTNNDAYRMALHALRRDSKAAALLGDDIKASGFVGGNVNFHNQSGQAELTIPVRGSRGSGSLQLKAEKRDGIWHFEKLKLFSPDLPESLDLLREGGGGHPETSP
jgi:hypothetical protein